jgi:hypothetical protein
MKKMIMGCIAAAALAAGIATAIPANAIPSVIGDEGDYSALNYRDELRYSGLYHEDVSNATELGPRICRQRAEGYSSSWLEDGLIYSPDRYTVEQAVAIVRGAEWHFCPVYWRD